VYGLCQSLLSPWWVIKDPRCEENLDAFVAAAWLSLWLDIVFPLKEERDWTHSHLAGRAGWTFDKWNNLKKGKTYKKDGPPILELYRLAAQFNVEISDFLPSCRDVHTIATRRLIKKHDPSFNLAGAAVEAYVEYHSQNPAKDFGIVDMDAVRRTYDVFSEEFESVEETEAAIIRVAQVIDSIILTTGGGS
jgi:hypothetical protein